MLKENVDLSNKCGSCKFGEPCTFSPKGERSYVQCGHPGKKFKAEYQSKKQRTAPGCAKYVQREGG